MKKYVLMGLVAGLMLTIITFSACANKPGALPTLSIGDKWVHKGIVKTSGPDVETLSTLEVTGEEVIGSKSLYVEQGTVKPGTETGSQSVSVVTKVDKATMQSVNTRSEWSSGEVVVLTFSYEFPGAIPFPLSVGKEYKMVTTVANASNATNTFTGTF